MLYVVCVNAGNYLGRGKEYVEKLYDMVIRNLPDGFAGKFVCFTDDKEPYDPHIEKRPLGDNLPGWWNKLWIFKHGHFGDNDRVIFFDLDTCIVGPLDGIAKYEGRFAILRDFYRPKGLQSSVMLWKANSVDIWEKWNEAGRPILYGGDQSYIEQYFGNEEPDILQNIFPDCFKSIKGDARFDIPLGTRVVYFHGDPKPHSFSNHWVNEVWKIGGGTVHSWIVEGNTPDAVLDNNIRKSLLSGLEVLADQYLKEANQPLLICGGGPSLADNLANIKLMEESGAIIWALNGSFRFLLEHGIAPHAQLILDAREENIEFVPERTDALMLYAAQCHEKVLDKARKAGKVILWCPSVENILKILKETGTRGAVVSGGSSVGLKAIGLSWLFGFKEVHLYGYDSSYRDNKNHAYEQPLNANDRIIEVTLNGQKFKCAPWMVTQAEEFRHAAQSFVAKGMKFVIHGEGLLPTMAKLMEST